MNNEDEYQKITITKMMAQKQVSKKSSSPVVRKKVSIKKPAIKQIIQRKLSDDEKSTELQNLMELIDIKEIIQELVQKELARLGFINMWATKTLLILIYQRQMILWILILLELKMKGFGYCRGEDRRCT